MEIDKKEKRRKSRPFKYILEKSDFFQNAKMSFLWNNFNLVSVAAFFLRLDEGHFDTQFT